MRGSQDLAGPEQLKIADRGINKSISTRRFDEKIGQFGPVPLKPKDLEIFQINVGYLCNQTCKHCHVDAGPDRKEVMKQQVMELCLNKIREFGVATVDITGGAPELNPDFRWFVGELRNSGVDEIIVRSNLTVVLANPKYGDLPEFFAGNELRVISSLPFYHASKTDRQRGSGVFDKSIKVLQMLNRVGYGAGDLILDLVYNPAGAYLPAGQIQLEKDFKRVLLEEHNIRFNQLFTLANLPINRFLEYLITSGNFEDYMNKLINAFNPSTIDGLMCRNTISVDYLGRVFDCDFNQMLNLEIDSSRGSELSELTLDSIRTRAIQTGDHCFGCTAGAGSSCQGSLVE